MAPSGPVKPKRYYEFGPFRIDLSERSLLREGKAVALTPKAYQTLIVLVENNTRTVTKQELLERVWPDTFVEELTLAQNISTLRKALAGDRDENKYIETVPRRGYRFVADVREFLDDAPPSPVNEASTDALPYEKSKETTDPISPVDTKRDIDHSPTVSTRPYNLRGPAIWFGLMVGVVGIVVVSYFFLTNRGRQQHPIMKVRSIAVLPFTPLETDNRDETLELGMADALITKLSNIRQIVVRPTSSILKYHNLGQDPLAIGREQQVDSLLEGKIQLSGNRVRVTVQLLRVSDGLSLWAAKFDETFTNIFSVQDSISQQAVDALALELSDEQQRQLAKRYTQDTEAYRLYVKGRFFWNKFNPEGLTKAIEYFNQAIAIDPTYALAYTGLSVSYNVQGAFGIVSPSETWTEARRAAQKAVELDDALAEAHSALGGVKLLYEWDWPSAGKELKRAIELNPNNAEAHELYAYYYQAIGDLDKALYEIMLAQKLDPVSVVISDDLVQGFYYRRNYDDAIKSRQKVAELDPHFLEPIYNLGQAYERKGEYDRAIEECQKALVVFGRDPAILSVLSYAYGVSGRRNEAIKIANELETMWRGHYYSPTNLALAWTGLGDKDKALVWLTKAYESRDPQLVWVKLEPQFEILHSDHRFQSLLQRIGFAR